MKEASHRTSMLNKPKFTNNLFIIPRSNSKTYSLTLHSKTTKVQWTNRHRRTNSLPRTKRNPMIPSNPLPMELNYLEHLIRNRRTSHCPPPHFRKNPYGSICTSFQIHCAPKSRPFPTKRGFQSTGYTRSPWQATQRPTGNSHSCLRRTIKNFSKPSSLQI